MNPATPIKSDYPNFHGDGLTSGKAREWDIQNLDYIQYKGEYHLFPEGFVDQFDEVDKIPFDQALGTMEFGRVIKK